MFKVFVFIVIILAAFANGAPTPDHNDLKSLDEPALLTSTATATKITINNNEDDSKDEVLETAPFLWGSWGYAPRYRYYYPSYNNGYNNYYRPYYYYNNGWGYNNNYW